MSPKMSSLAYEEDEVQDLASELVLFKSRHVSLCFPNFTTNLEDVVQVVGKFTVSF